MLRLFFTGVRMCGAGDVLLREPLLAVLLEHDVHGRDWAAVVEPHRARHPLMRPLLLLLTSLFLLDLLAQHLQGAGQLPLVRHALVPLLGNRCRPPLDKLGRSDGEKLLRGTHGGDGGRWRGWCWCGCGSRHLHFRLFFWRRSPFGESFGPERSCGVVQSLHGGGESLGGEVGRHPRRQVDPRVVEVVHDVVHPGLVDRARLVACEQHQVRLEGADADDPSDLRTVLASHRL
mmetsp:Transcript_20776/g.59278  ORF Transcript_20776/g.59278 Transcript_20776/m.59278 type:complete len:232 (-) Transcript_20776:1154-1849(-)